jgi:hypothetical protein
MFSHFHLLRVSKFLALVSFFGFTSLSLHGQSIQSVPNTQLEAYLATKYSPEILNCEVCRQRLGLPPLASASQSSSNAHSAAIPSPSVTHALPSRPILRTQSPIAGDPPSPSTDLSQFSFAERQRLMREIEVPPGGRVLSFRVLDSSQTAGKNAVEKTPPQSNGQHAPETWNLPSVPDQRFTPKNQTQTTDPLNSSTRSSDPSSGTFHLVADTVSVWSTSAASDIETNDKCDSEKHSNAVASDSTAEDTDSFCKDSEKSKACESKSTPEEDCCKDEKPCCENSKPNDANPDEAKCCDKEKTSECKESCCTDEKQSSSTQVNSTTLENSEGQYFSFVTDGEFNAGDPAQQLSDGIRLLFVAGEDGDKAPQAMVLRALPNQDQPARDAAKAPKNKKNLQGKSAEGVPQAKQLLPKKITDRTSSSDSPTGKQIQELTSAINRLAIVIQRAHPVPQDGRMELEMESTQRRNKNAQMQSEAQRHRDDVQRHESERDAQRHQEQVAREQMQQALERRERETRANQEEMEREMVAARQRVEEMQREIAEKNDHIEQATEDAHQMIMRLKELVEKKSQEIEKLKAKQVSAAEQKAKAAKAEAQKKKQPKPN